MLPPEAGMSYLVLQLEYEGTDGGFAYNPLYLAVRDPAGKTYNISIGADPEKLMDAGELKPGEKKQGMVAFELPKGDCTLEISDELMDVRAKVQISGG